MTQLQAILLVLAFILFVSLSLQQEPRQKNSIHTTARDPNSDFKYHENFKEAQGIHYRRTNNINDVVIETGIDANDRMTVNSNDDNDKNDRNDRKIKKDLSNEENLQKGNIFGKHAKVDSIERPFKQRFSELHLTLLPPSKVHASFRFEDEDNIIPIDASFELSMTQGRYINGKPAGLELRVECSPEEYKSIMHTLSGLFCASINFLDVEASEVYSAGTVASRVANTKSTLDEEGMVYLHKIKMTSASASNTTNSPSIHNERKNNSSNNKNRVYYGALIRETVCTENLTPFKNLMKNDATSGLSHLLNPIKLFDSEYYSMQVEYQKKKNTRLIQKVDVVFDLLDGVEERYIKNWSLNQLFDRVINAPNPLEDKSNVYIHVSKRMVEFAGEKSNLHQNRLKILLSAFQLASNERAKNVVEEYELISGKKYFKIQDTERIEALETLYTLQPKPDYIFNSDSEIVYKYDVMSFLRRIENIHFLWKNSAIPAPGFHVNHSTVSAHRFQTGYGQLEGGLTVTIENHEEEDVLIRYFDFIPWMFRVYFHTLEISINDGTPLPLYSSAFEYFSVKPSIEKKIPSEIEFALRLPAQSKITLSVQFEKVMLGVTQHPPDGNRGFDLLSSVVTYCKIKSDSSCNLENLSIFHRSPVNRIYTEPLLITLPTPDYSMPYNVIMLTSTVLALFFGSLFNVLTQDVNKEE